jgi:hypothetical protein
LDGPLGEVDGASVGRVEQKPHRREEPLEAAQVTHRSSVELGQQLDAFAD